MSTVLAEPINLGDVLLYEDENYFYSRDEITLAIGQAVAIGQLLGRVTDSGEYVAFDPAATDGSENATAIAVRNMTTTTDIAETVAIVRHAIVKRDGLVWPEGITEAEQADAEAQLLSQGILIRR